MQGLFSEGAKETRAALSELFERISYHPQRRSPRELASDVVRELAHRNLLREEGAQEPKPIVHPDVATLDGVDESNDEGDWDADKSVRDFDKAMTEHQAWLDEHPEADGMA